MKNSGVVVRKKKKIKRADIIFIVFCVVIMLITIIPVWQTVVYSFSDPLLVRANAVKLWPKDITLTGYKLVLQQKPFWKSVGITVFYCAAAVVIQLTNVILLGYPLTATNLKFRKVINAYLMITMYFGGGLIPSFILVSKLGLYNTIWALLLPGVGIWNTILFKTYVSTLPMELRESAMLDGAGHISMLTKILLPLSKPILAVLAMYVIVGNWNSWFGAMIYIMDEDLQPVQYYLKKLVISLDVDVAADMLKGMTAEQRAMYAELQTAGEQMKYVLISVTTIPILIVYPFFQKHFTKGIMLGSLKG